jgi:hypothetical protein
MNAETRLAELLETQWAPTNKAVLFADITAVVGLEATALVVGTIKAASAQNPLMDTIIIAMSTVGLSLSTAERQGVIDMLAHAGQWPDAARDAVKALGGTWQPRWQLAGYESEPTLATVQAEIDAARLINAKALFNERMTIGGDASSVWSQAWIDAEAV